MLSKKAKYALKALTVLCKEIHQPSVGIAEIARQENIPHKFLESILRELRLEGYLISKRGKGGGYALFRNPESISVGEIIRLMDGRMALTACASSRDGKPCSDCVMPHRCTIRPLMVSICKTTDHMLDRTSLLDIVRQEME
jgi:Rrf2 family protein